MTKGWRTRIRVQVLARVVGGFRLFHYQMPIYNEPFPEEVLLASNRLQRVDFSRACQLRKLPNYGRINLPPKFSKVLLDSRGLKELADRS
jgi:hypothetical protein